RHRGRVVLVTSTINTDWTSWPIAPSFAPFMQELLRFAVLQPPRRTVTVGEPLDELLPPSTLAADAAVTTPDGRTESVPLRAEPHPPPSPSPGPDQPGWSRARVGARGGDLWSAATPPAGVAESDLRRTTAEELRQLTPADDVQVVTDLGALRRVPKRLTP